MLDCQRASFEIPPDVAYLNAAAYCPLPTVVRQAGELGVAAKSAPWAMPGATDPRVRQDDAVRGAVARLIGGDG